MYLKLTKKQPALVNCHRPVLLHDNTRHYSIITSQKLNELSYEVLPHPPYSPNISLTDYDLFGWFFQISRNQAGQNISCK